MPASVREEIVANIQTTLRLIDAGATYDNTIEDAAIQRWNSNGNPRGTVPMILIYEASESRSDKSFRLTHCRMSIFLALMCRQTEDDSTSAGTLLNSLLGDITKALKVDVTRGGYAVDTEITDVSPLETEEGQEEFGLLITVDVEYRHDQTNPKTVA